MVWRVNLLLEGKYPSCDINGRLLQGSWDAGCRPRSRCWQDFALTELRGDWVWLKDCLSFRSSWKGGSTYPVCFKCEARVREPYLYYNVQTKFWSMEHRIPQLSWILGEPNAQQPSDLAENVTFVVFNQWTRYPKSSGHWCLIYKFVMTFLINLIEY